MNSNDMKGQKNNAMFFKLMLTSSLNSQSDLTNTIQ